MDAAVKNLTEEDIVNIVAYTASLDRRWCTPFGCDEAAVALWPR